MSFNKIDVGNKNGIIFTYTKHNGFITNYELIYLYYYLYY